MYSATPINFGMSQYANITEPETAIECVVPNGTEKASQSDFKDLLVLSIEYSDFFNVPSKEIPATTIAVDSPSAAIIIGSPSLLTRSASGNVISFPHMIDDIYEAPYSFNDFRVYIGKFVYFLLTLVCRGEPGFLKRHSWLSEDCLTSISSRFNT